LQGWVKDLHKLTMEESGGEGGVLKKGNLARVDEYNQGLVQYWRASWGCHRFREFREQELHDLTR